MAVIKIPAICKIYANLILNDLKSIEDIQEKYLQGTGIALSAKKVIARTMTFKEALELCATNDEKETLIKYLKDEGKGYLVEE